MLKAFSVAELLPCLRPPYLFPMVYALPNQVTYLCRFPTLSSKARLL